MLRDFLDHKSLLVGPLPANDAYGGKTEYIYKQGLVNMDEAYGDLYVELEENMVNDSLDHYTILYLDCRQNGAVGAEEMT